MRKSPKTAFGTKIGVFAVFLRKIRISQKLKDFGPKKPHASAIMRYLRSFCTPCRGPNSLSKASYELPKCDCQKC